MPTNEQVTGLGLKLERVAARVKQWQVAEHMGVSPSRVAAIEREAVVSTDTAFRYRTAMRMCGTGTSPEAEVA
jgi:plasmid maintenance system antidote protein VapI